MLLLALGVILFVVMYQRKVIHHQLELEKINTQQQRKLIHASIQGEEEERTRIASELHDDVGADLSSVKLFLNRASKETPGKYVEQSKQLLDISIQKLRNISYKLQPTTLFHLGLEQSIQNTADVINKSDSLQMDYIIKSKQTKLDKQALLYTYRILQELLNNLMKHAHANEVCVTTEQKTNCFSLLLEHDGQGLTQTDYEKKIYQIGSLGLKNIENRVKAINGSITYNKEGLLFSVLLKVPNTR